MAEATGQAAVTAWAVDSTLAYRHVPHNDDHDGEKPNLKAPHKNQPVPVDGEKHVIDEVIADGNQQQCGGQKGEEPNPKRDRKTETTDLG